MENSALITVNVRARTASKEFVGRSKTTESAKVVVSARATDAQAKSVLAVSATRTATAISTRKRITAIWSLELETSSSAQLSYLTPSNVRTAQIVKAKTVLTTQKQEGRHAWVSLSQASATEIKTATLLSV